MLRQGYDFLCEFAHPNFHSNKISFDLDKVGERFVFRHGQKMRDEEFRIYNYLLISTALYVKLHDAIDEVLPSAAP
jgi:hypothetical protein